MSAHVTLTLDTTAPVVHLVRGGRRGTETYAYLTVSEPALIEAEARDPEGGVFPLEVSGNRVWTNSTPAPGTVIVWVRATDVVGNALEYEFPIVVGDATLRSWADDLLPPSTTGSPLCARHLTAAILSSSLADAPCSGSDPAATLTSGSSSG